MALPFLKRGEIAPPPDIEAASLRSDRFRLEREGDWQRLEKVVRSLERGRRRSISDEDLLAFPVLYRQAASSLAVARETSLDAATLAYLESLVRRAWFQVYGPRTSFGEWLRGFAFGGWSRAVRSLWLEICVSLFVMVASTVVGWLLVARDQDWYFALVPESFLDERQPGATRAVLEKTLEGTPDAGGLAAFATYLFSNNTGASILCFALGFAFGLPTVLLLVLNTASLGAMLHLYFNAGLGWQFVAWLAIHGTTELIAIMLSGAAGLHIGKAMVFPGDRTIMAAMSDSGKRAATVMAGVVVMLVIAGLLEGFGRQLVHEASARGLIGGTMLLLWINYFLWPGRTRRAGVRT